MKISFVESQRFFDVFALTDTERAEASEYITEGIFGEASAELFYSYSHGCLLIKLYSEDMGYYFWPAVPLSESGDTSAAYRAIAEYCKLEAIPEVYVDVSAEDVEIITAGAPHASVHDLGDGAFAVEIFTECMLSEFLPEHMYGELYFGELAPLYDSDYERLIKDTELNKYFGYNMCDDIPNGGGADFREAAVAQLECGEAMTFALTVYRDEKNVFVGEAALYGFDGRGGASVAFRILPEWQGRGLGRAALCGSLEIAEKIGLTRVSAEVMEGNVRSRSLLSSLVVPREVSNGIYLFEFSRGENGKFL